MPGQNILGKCPTCCPGPAPCPCEGSWLVTITGGITCECIVGTNYFGLPDGQYIVDTVNTLAPTNDVCEGTGLALDGHTASMVDCATGELLLEAPFRCYLQFSVVLDECWVIIVVDAEIFSNSFSYIGKFFADSEHSYAQIAPDLCNSATHSLGGGGFATIARIP